MSAKQRDSGSRIEQYAAKPAAYEDLYSTGGDDDATKQAARDRKQAAANNRHLRWASSHGDLRATLRLDENAKLPGNRNGGGVGDALENQSRDKKTGEGRTREGLILEEQARKRAAAELGNNSPASPPVPVPRGAANSTANGINQTFPSTAPLKPGDPVPPAPAGGAGAAPYTPIPGEKAVAPYTAIPTTKPSVSAPTPSTGQITTGPATTPPVAQGGAANGKPAVPDWRQQRATALEALKGKFTKQDAANALAKESEPKGIDPKYQASKETLDMESKFKAMIADRPADQKAMFAALPEKDKAAMVQKNESLKTVREEEAKLGPDKNSNAEQAKALISGAKKEVSGIVNAVDAARKNFMDPMGDSDFRVNAMREKRGALEESNSSRSANLGGQVADGIEQETIRNNAIRQTEEDAIQNAHEMSVIGSVETPTDYYQAESESASKPSPTKSSTLDSLSVSQPNDLDWNVDFNTLFPKDPRYKALEIKNSSYGQAWMETPGSLIPALRHDLNKDPSLVVRERARQRMISKSIEQGVDISGITKQDPSFHKQYEEAKKNQKSDKSNAQSSNDVKLQQHHASIDAAKGVLQGARKITDDIWGADYNAVPA